MYQLTINCATLADLSAAIAKLSSGVALPTTVATTQMQPPASVGDDDEGSDATAAPGTLDKNGLPWDERIHSTPAKITSKGVWRAKRGVADGLVAQVEAELRARGTQTQPATPVYQPPVQQQPAPQFVPPQTAPVQQQQPPVYQPPVQQQPYVEQTQQYQQPAPAQYAPQPAPMQQPPVYQPPVQQQPATQFPPEPQQYDFNAFMQRLQLILKVMDASGNAIVDANYLNGVAQRIGVAFQQPVGAITDIAGNQAMINYAIDLMRAEQKWF